MHDDMRLLRIVARGAGPGLAGDGLEERVADRFSEQPGVAGASRHELAGTEGGLHLQRGTTRGLTLPPPTAVFSRKQLVGCPSSKVT